jgi:hypothetical protein
MERMGINFRVEERSGIRRFLYPLKARLPSMYRRSIGKLAVAEADGRLVPSHVAVTPNGIECVFALSLAPLETRDLYLVRTDQTPKAAIPDPLKISWQADGFASSQDRVSFGFGQLAQLRSVIYDSVEHLAGPLAITLDGSSMSPRADSPPVRTQIPESELSARFAAVGAYHDLRPAQVSGETNAELVCCKSWVEIRHTVSNPQPNSSLRFSLPLTITSEQQTCDFGVGNGAYGKIQSGAAERVIWEVDLSHERVARYRIRTQLASGELRTDYAGELKNSADLHPCLWMHWIEPTKALGLAITQVAKGCERISVRLGSDGIVEAEFLIGRTTMNPAEFGICYHFLNAVPPIAAATNPASILNPPKITIVKG